ncbi:hypothetical protein [Pandoraea sp. PE-S2T-3]|uniref:hypothetical protein n=1 Tax=Pandoraea sp. PE-S2T-3 TaxID=1986993 RepID=UPI000B3F6D38|nr:hypothetical protein [Pandoraea sp. PE-S2T-3]
MTLITPYLSVGSVRFGMSAGQLILAMGTPNRTSKNRRGELVFDYPAARVVIALDEAGVVEVGIVPNHGVVSVEGIPLFSPNDSTSFEMLIEKDGAAYESLGFVVLLNIGITLTGFHDGDESQKALTAFARGRWDGMRSKLLPLKAKI